MGPQLIIGIAFLAAVILGITTSRYLLRKSLEASHEGQEQNE